MAHDHSSMSGMPGMSGMSGMDHGGASMECNMHMLGNWQTTNICILTSSWHVRTNAQFAGTCIGVFLIVFLIETIRRWGRELDRWIVEQAEIQRRERRRAEREIQRALVEAEKAGQPRPQVGERIDSIFFGLPRSRSGRANQLAPPRFRPTMVQQAIRSLFYGCQFAGAYIVMLIAMSFNGYILISIIAGGMFGHFFSTLDTLGSPSSEEELDHDYSPHARSTPRVTAAREPTGVKPDSIGKDGDAATDDDDGISVESSDGEPAPRRGVRRKAVGPDAQQQDHVYGTGTCCG